MKFKKPRNIPFSPEKVYKHKGWISAGVFLGTGNISSNRKQFLSFEKAKECAIELYFSSKNEWRDYCKSGNRIKNLPSEPHVIYKNKGWISWNDFLGVSIKDRWMPYCESRLFVRSLGLKDKHDWFQYCKSEKKQKNIPTYPYNAYKKSSSWNQSAWKGLSDFLGLDK